MTEASAPATAFAVVVPEAEALVHDLRERFDPVALLGVPAHITVLYPFLLPDEITPAVLDRAAAALADHAAFAFRLGSVARFPHAVYLAPQPAAPFVALTEALVRAFPGFAPYGGMHASIVPHLTVGQGDVAAMDPVAAELQAGLRQHGPVQARCDGLSLLENAGGRWRERHRWVLPSQGAEARWTSN
jgi:2'-5' RNA ligase